jgi:hypothetical protein
MRRMQPNRPTGADDDAVAAALAAVQLYLAAEEPSQGSPPRPQWQVAGVLAGQGLRPPRAPARPAWASADRAGSAERWSTGVLGGFD